MGTDSSKFPSQDEDSIDAYMDRDGGYVVNKHRRSTTVTTIDIGLSQDMSSSRANSSSTDQLTASITPDKLYYSMLNISLSDFQSIIMSSRSNKQLEQLLLKKLSLPSTFIQGALRRAVASRKIELLRHALEVNKLFPPDCSLRADDSLILQFIQKAISKQDIESLSCLLGYLTTTDLSSTKSDLQNFAILAAQIGFLDAVLILCSKYQCCLDQTEQGHCVLLDVVRSSSVLAPQITSELLRLGINPNVQEPSGDTALHCAVVRQNVELVKLLLEHGACTEFPNFRKQTPLALSSNAEISSLLREATGPTLPDVSIYYAAKHGNNEALKKLLQKGMAINSKWIFGQTALSPAARRGDKLMVELLLSNGASAFPTGSVWPELPIAHALKGGNLQIACRLVSCVDLEYDSATEMMKRHIKKQFVSLLHFCSSIGAVKVAELIITSRYDVKPNDAYEDNLAPIHKACQHGQLEMVKLLLAYGISPCLPSQVYLNTPLHYACFYGQTHVANYLLTTYSDQVLIDCTNKSLETPLYCVLNGQLSTKETGPVREKSVVYLIGRGAKLIKPGRSKCELLEFNLNYAAQRWTFIPYPTQKLIMVLRDELQPYSLGNQARFTIRSSLPHPVTEEVVDKLNLPYRIHNYVLLKDWFPTN